jgi:hypothetical protein
MKNPETRPFILAWLVALLFYVLEYATRSSPAVMIPQLESAYSVSALGVSGILGTYYYAYSISSLVAGASIDRFGAKAAVSLGLLILAVGCFAFAVSDANAAYGGRLLQGVGSAFAFTGAVYLASRGFCAGSLATAIGVTQCMGVSLSGDGGFTMMMGDFITLSQQNLPLKVIVLNNGTLGFVEMEMKAGGFLDVGCDLKNPNFAAMAQSMGVKGIRVEKPQDLEGALGEALAHPGPVLVDVVSARQELVMPPKTTLDHALHFGVFMMKAVLDGRGAELLDLATVNLSR